MSQHRRSVLKLARGRIAGTLVIPLAVAAAFPAGARHHGLLTAPQLDAELVIDATSGSVLFARNEIATRHPASLTKMMTLYLLFEKLGDNTLTLQSAIPVSAEAACEPRAHLGIAPGSTIVVDTAIRAIVIRSANDVAVAVAEAIGGSEQRFVDLMNAKARDLRMTHTAYFNASGLPDDRQVTSAGDQAVLAWHLMHDFPQYFPYFSTPSMNWRGEEINTHNMLIGNYAGADGIKTGYTDASGYNLVASVLRGRTRLIAVVLGGITAEKRDEAMVNLLDNAFAQTNVATSR